LAIAIRTWESSKKADFSKRSPSSSVFLRTCKGRKEHLKGEMNNQELRRGPIPQNMRSPMSIRIWGDMCRSQCCLPEIPLILKRDKSTDSLGDVPCGTLVHVYHGIVSI
jgi:hypothetical protein